MISAEDVAERLHDISKGISNETWHIVVSPTQLTACEWMLAAHLRVQDV